MACGDLGRGLEATWGRDHKKHLKKSTYPVAVRCFDEAAVSGGCYWSEGLFHWVGGSKHIRLFRFWSTSPSAREA
jgi:hypothetical protein